MSTLIDATPKKINIDNCELYFTRKLQQGNEVVINKAPDLNP